MNTFINKQEKVLLWEIQKVELRQKSFIPSFYLSSLEKDTKIIILIVNLIQFLLKHFPIVQT